MSAAPAKAPTQAPMTVPRGRSPEDALEEDSGVAVAEADVEDAAAGVGVEFASVTTTDWVPARPGTGPV